MNEIVIFKDLALPFQIGNDKLGYSESQNMFVTTGYTSYAGNTYFSGIRFSERIVIMLNIGIGYYYTFLNGLSVFSYLNNQKICIGSKSYYNHKYNEQSIKRDAKIILKDKLLEKATEEKLVLDDLWLSQYVDTLVEDTYKNQKETIKTIHTSRLLPN